MVLGFEVLLARVADELSQLAVDEAHVIASDRHIKIDRCLHGVVMVLVKPAALHVGLLVVVLRTVSLGVHAPCCCRRARWLAAHLACALQNSDGVGALTHEDNALLGRVQDFEIHTQGVCQRPPRDLALAAQARRTEDEFCVLERGAGENAIVDVERGGHLDCVMEEETVVGGQGFEAEGIELWPDSLIVQERPLRNTRQCTGQLSVQGGQVKGADGSGVWIVTGGQLHDDTRAIHLVAIEGCADVPLEEEQPLSNGPGDEHFQRGGVHHGSSCGVEVNTVLETIPSGHGARLPVGGVDVRERDRLLAGGLDLESLLDGRGGRAMRAHAGHVDDALVVAGDGEVLFDAWQPVGAVRAIERMRAIARGTSC